MKSNLMACGMAICSLLALSAAADAGAGLSSVPERGRWSFSIGPSWRSRVKMETRGVAYGHPAAESHTQTAEDPADRATWDLEAVDDPMAGITSPLGEKLWSTKADRQIVDVLPGDALAAIRQDDDDAPLGLNLQACYDFYKGETLSVGLNLRFAGYWNMKSSSSAPIQSSQRRVRDYVDHYYLDALYSGDAQFDLYDIGAVPMVDGDGNVTPWNTDAVGDTGWYSLNDGRVVSTRLRADLYQIGLGPKVTWSPFVGRCDSLSWLDVYGGVEVLCNIAHSEFDADGRSSSQTDCLLGFGGNVGLVGNITDWIGIYGQVGYEWIDDTDVSTGGFKADVDYSSLVLSAGVQVRF